MALSLGSTASTTQTEITRVIEGLFGVQPGSTILSSFVASAEGSSTGAVANSLMQYVDAADKASEADLAAVVAANFGIVESDTLSADAVTEAVDFVTAQLVAAGEVNWGSTVLEMANLFAGLTADATYGAAAVAFNDVVLASLDYSLDADNTEIRDVTGGGTTTATTTFFLTSGTDRGGDFNGTSGNDEFLAYIEQNEFAGGVSNSLSSADHLDGGAGADSLHAELTQEFVGVDGHDEIDVQPRTTSIETVTIEARDDNGTVILDAKHMTAIEEIGSALSDGDLVIENLTTLTDAGVARNTEDLTITMDHTDNFNSDDDASDLTVYFDEDYLLSGQSTGGATLTVQGLLCVQLCVLAFQVDFGGVQEYFVRHPVQLLLRLFQYSSVHPLFDFISGHIFLC